MGFMGGQELLIILAIVIILFGAKKIPELASGLGKGIKEFKKASKDIEKGIECSTDNDDIKKEKNKNS
jgi:sec-independent protein translocase protein TatA